MVAPGPKRLEVFARDRDGALLQWSWDGAHWSPSLSWRGPTRVGPNERVRRFGSNPAVLLREGRIELFAWDVDREADANGNARRLLRLVGGRRCPTARLSGCGSRSGSSTEQARVPGRGRQRAHGRRSRPRAPRGSRRAWPQLVGLRAAPRRPDGAPPHGAGRAGRRDVPAPAHRRGGLACRRGPRNRRAQPLAPGRTEPGGLHAYGRADRADGGRGARRRCSGRRSCRIPTHPRRARPRPRSSCRGSSSRRRSAAWPRATTTESPMPLMNSGSVGLWRARIRAVAGGPAALTAGLELQTLKSGAADPFATALGQADRQLIRAQGAPARLDRLELSALGGSLSAHGSWPGVRWDHEATLGRDQQGAWRSTACCTQAGTGLSTPRSPSGWARSRVPGPTAELRKRTVLTVTEPTRDEPDDPALARAFPFARTEIATLEFAGVDDPNDPDLHPAGTRGAWTKYPRTPLLSEAHAKQKELEDRRDAWPPLIDELGGASEYEALADSGDATVAKNAGTFSSSSSRSTWSRTRSRPPRTTRRPCRGSSGRCATGSRSSSPSVARARPAASSSACRCSSSPTRISSRPRRCPRSTRCDDGTEYGGRAQARESLRRREGGCRDADR